MDGTTLDPASIRDRRQANLKMRERDFARIHGITEAGLVAAHVGHGAIRLDCNVAAVLNGLPAVGEVMALTRNEYAVHEKIGPFERISVGEFNALVLGDEIDLRIFPSRWKHAFAVAKPEEGGPIRRSLQFFDAAGDAVFKVHLREKSDLVAYAALVDRLASPDQQPSLLVPVVAMPSAKGQPGTVDELRIAWRAMTDTHQFFGMLKKLNLERLEALRMIDRDLAWRVPPVSIERTLKEAASTELPIMAFVGNQGCIQIHQGPVRNIQATGPWLNIMDETFHLHLRLDQIAELWAVRKPTSDGLVSSLEAYASDGALIIQFFGVRHEGVDELPSWRALVDALPGREAVLA